MIVTTEYQRKSYLYNVNGTSSMTLSDVLPAFHGHTKRYMATDVPIAFSFGLLLRCVLGWRTCMEQFVQMRVLIYVCLFVCC